MSEKDNFFLWDRIVLIVEGVVSLCRLCVVIFNAAGVFFVALL